MFGERDWIVIPCGNKNHDAIQVEGREALGLLADKI
jgi:hypothetical protein